jgi:hypothetical protein
MQYINARPAWKPCAKNARTPIFRAAKHLRTRFKSPGNRGIVGRNSPILPEAAMRIDGICLPKFIFVLVVCLQAFCPLAIPTGQPVALGAQQRQAARSFSLAERAHWSFQPVHRPAVPRLL